eukprot:gene26260-17362_t
MERARWSWSLAKDISSTLVIEIYARLWGPSTVALNEQGSSENGNAEMLLERWVLQYSKGAPRGVLPRRCSAYDQAFQAAHQDPTYDGHSSADQSDHLRWGIPRCSHQTITMGIPCSHRPLANGHSSAAIRPQLTMGIPVKPSDNYDGHSSAAIRPLTMGIPVQPSDHLRWAFQCSHQTTYDGHSSAAIRPLTRAFTVEAIDHLRWAIPVAAISHLRMMGIPVAANQTTYDGFQ